MTSPLRIAVAQPICAPGDVERNVAAHVDAVQPGRARLFVFPELSLTGYLHGADPVEPDDPRLRPLTAACGRANAVALVGAPVERSGTRHIAALRIDGGGTEIAYRKCFLGGAEAVHYSPGPGPVALDVDGWRVGIGVCKDTGTSAHIDATVGLGIDLYVAGLVHAPAELAEQDARGVRIAGAGRIPVAFASAAGLTGPDYPNAIGHSTIWSADGRVAARASAAPGAWVSATLTRPAR